MNRVGCPTVINEHYKYNFSDQPMHGSCIPPSNGPIKKFFIVLKNQKSHSNNEIFSLIFFLCLNLIYFRSINVKCKRLKKFFFFLLNGNLEYWNCCCCCRLSCSTLTCSYQWPEVITKKKQQTWSHSPLLRHKQQFTKHVKNETKHKSSRT